MPAYGDMASIKRMLAASGTVWNADADERLSALNTALSLAFDAATGRTFGTGPLANAQRVVSTRGNSAILVLPSPVRSVSAVVIAPTWGGTAWTLGTTLAATNFTPIYPNTKGEYYALRSHVGAYWSDPTLVTAQWADTDADATVPDDVRYVVNYLVAERFKVENAGPAGFSGPDGATIPIRDALKDPLVRLVIDTYSAPLELVI
ncbi:MAG: hypothetical protein M3Q82_04020 [Actinomycetota bacterium]|nr:hypothetical protein [Actinomycetota bacterium]